MLQTTYSYIIIYLHVRFDTLFFNGSLVIFKNPKLDWPRKFAQPPCFCCTSYKGRTTITIAVFRVKFCHHRTFQNPSLNYTSTLPSQKFAMRGIISISDFMKVHPWFQTLLCGYVGEGHTNTRACMPT
jgi:hypothetical protein